MLWENLFPWSNLLTLGLALKRSSWKLLLALSNTSLPNKLNFIIIQTQLMYGLLESSLMRYCMEPHSIQEKIIKKSLIRYWKCLLKLGIRISGNQLEIFYSLYWRKNLIKDQLSQWFVQLLKKYWNKLKKKEQVNFKRVSQIKIRRVKLATRLEVISLKVLVIIKWFLWIVPQRKMVLFIVVKSMKAALWKERNKNCKRHGSQI